jgi:hypothetical protein
MGYRDKSGPVYMHDCGDCVYKGSVEEVQTKEVLDIYRCSQGGVPTWVARSGDLGHEYSSLAEFALDSETSSLSPVWSMLSNFARRHV